MSRRPQSSQAKSWVFTLNNYSELEYGEIETYLRESAAYACVGRETGENGTPHLQGYFRLKKQCRLSQLKDKCSSRAHYEVARGTPASNRQYCFKEGSAYEVGVLPGNDGHNRDEIARAYDAALAGGRAGLTVFRESFPGAYAFSGHNLLRNWLAIQEPVERASIRC